MAGAKLFSGVNAPHYDQGSDTLPYDTSPNDLESDNLFKLQSSSDSSSMDSLVMIKDNNAATSMYPINQSGMDVEDLVMQQKNSKWETGPNPLVFEFLLIAFTLTSPCRHIKLFG